MRPARVTIAALLLGLSALASAAARAEDGHGAHLTLSRVLTGDAGEGASDEAKAEAEHETLQFWGAVVNFALLVYLIRRMSKKPLAAFLGTRRDEIEKGIAEAAEMKRKADAVFAEYDAKLRTLDDELEKLRADMAQAAAADKARIVADAEQSAVRLRAETDALVVRQTEQLQAQIKAEVVAAAILAAERAVAAATSADDQRRLAEAFARELATVGQEKRA